MLKKATIYEETPRGKHQPVQGIINTARISWAKVTRIPGHDHAVTLLKMENGDIVVAKGAPYDFIRDHEPPRRSML